jgi:TrmH family RNA methyltransferase
LDKNWQKRVKSLHLKKHRVQEGLFLVEGAKNVVTLLASDFEVEALFYTEAFYRENHEQLAYFPGYHAVTDRETLERCGTLQTNGHALAIVETKAWTLPPSPAPFHLVLDNIRDPGNLGTIVRLADWYGIPYLVCSPETVDFYNPKTIQATMGSFTQVQVIYHPLEAYLPQLAQTVALYAAVTDGHSVYQSPATFPAALLVGSESHGIDSRWVGLAQHQITIPRRGHAESLNAGVATAILCDHFIRQLPSLP